MKNALKRIPTRWIHIKTEDILQINMLKIGVQVHHTGIRSSDAVRPGPRQKLEREAG